MNWKLSDSISNRWAMITLLVGISITIFTTAQIESSNQARIKKAVKTASDQAIHSVKERITLYQYGLRGARGAVLTLGKEALSRRLFLRYSLSRDVNTEFPGARGFGFIRRVKQQDVSDFVASAQQDGWLDFHIKELSPNHGERYVIQYIEPVARNLQAVGLDIASEKNRREAAKAAIETGEVRLTGPITLVQATGNPLQSFLILMPIYDGGSTPDTPALREKLAYGWSYAPLLMQEVMQHLAIDREQARLELYDVTDPTQREQFFDSHPNSKHDLYRQISAFEVYGRKWESHFSVSPEFIADLHLPKPLDVFGVGILISLLSATLLGVLMVGRRHKQEVISQQAKMAAIVESSSDAIISTTLYGIVTSWNSSAEKIFGYRREAVLGESIHRLIIPKQFESEEKEIYRKIEKGEEVGHFDTIRMTKEGRDVPVSVAISPIYDATGKVIGASKSIRDISIQKAAEAQIRDLNNTLEKQVKERTEELQKLNLLLNDVLNASSEIAIIATDVDGKISLFNSGAQRMLKFSEEDVIGKLTPLSFHLDGELNKVRQELEAQAAANITTGIDVLFYKARRDGSDSREWTYVDKLGKPIDVSVVITPMHDNRGSVIGFLNMAMDISEQKASNAEILSMRDQLLMAANVARLGIWSWDIRTNSLDWNDIMFQIYQLPMSLRDVGVQYHHWADRLHPDDRERVKEAVTDAFNGTQDFDLTFRLVLPDGHIRHVQARAYIEFDRQGEAICLTGINRDVTSEYELETWLRKAKDEADAASLAKSEFLANMSHEIRTPMNAVLGMLQLVKRTSLNAQQEDYVSKAHIAAKSLLGLINDILDYSKVDAGKLEIERAPFAISQLLSELNTLLSGYSSNEKVTLRYDVDADIPSYLIGDYLRVLQVLTNLVSNALKFTIQGEVVVSVVQTQQDSNGCQLLFKVTDTGIGIDESKIERIFEVFSQAESSTARRFGGSGLGLVISRRLVNLMGGELLVTSEVDKGSCFYFSLSFPVAQEADVARIADEKSLANVHSDHNKLKGVSILVVEDNAFNRQVAEELLVAEGAQVTLAEGGEEGVAAVLDAEVGRFDLVLMDMQMPNVDGLEAARRIRRDVRFTDLPIIAMTANVSVADQEACLRAGMNDHIGKPLDVDLMIEVICRYAISDRVAIHAAMEPVDSSVISEIKEEAPSHVEERLQRVESCESIMARFAGNQALYKSLVDNFLQESETLIAGIEQGLQNQDATVVRERLHTLKGSTGTMGLTALSEEVAEIEQQLKQSESQEDSDKALAKIDPNRYRSQVKDDLDRILESLFGNE